MYLFRKEKDLILRITNLVLLIGFIVSLIVFYSGFVNLAFTNKLKTYIVFKEENCTCSVSEGICSIGQEEEECQNKYELYKEDFKTDNIVYKKRIISSALSSITVGLTIYLLNKEKKVKK